MKILFKKLKIKQKMMLYILGATALMYVVTFGYIGIELKEKSLQEARDLADSYTAQKANNINSRMQEDLSIARSMAVILSDYADLPKETRYTMQKSLMISILKKYPEYDAVWMSWELGAIDSTWILPYGRQRVTYFWKEGEIVEAIEIIDTDGENLTGDYYRLKEEEKEEISEPYISEDYEDGYINDLLITSPCVPIMKGDKFIGLIGTDYSLSNYAEVVEDFKYDHGFSFLLSNSGMVASHPDRNNIAKNVTEMSFVKGNEEISDIIKEGRFNAYTIYSEDYGQDVYVSFAPILLNRAALPWTVGTLVPLSDINNTFSLAISIMITAGFIGFVLLSIVIWNISHRFTSRIIETNQVMKEISSGNLDSALNVEIHSEDELGEMRKSVNQLLLTLNEKSRFSEEIGKGNLNMNFSPSSDKDELGHSLERMRGQLQSTFDETQWMLKNAAQEGNFDDRLKLEDKSGVWREMAHGTNELLNSFAIPLKSLNGIINSLAEGDLSQRYEQESKGDIAKMSLNLNMAIDNLNEIFNKIMGDSQEVDKSTGEMKTATEELTINTSEIASAIGEMNNGAQMQLLKVDESSNLIEGILSSSNEMADKALSINMAAKSAVDKSENGLKMMDNVVHNMSDITDYSQKTQESIGILTNRSNEISRVLAVITEIAAQTNLLALNAAIEAAQAGDAGRGFAVVAEEIRKLAEDSRASAREIEQLVSDVQNDTQEAEKVIGFMDSSVRNGADASAQASKVFREIYDSASTNLNYSEEIVNDTKEQIKHINEVVSITESVVVIAEQTAAGTEQITTSATEMSSGVNLYNSKIQQLAQVAESLQSGVNNVKLSAINQNVNNLTDDDELSKTLNNGNENYELEEMNRLTT